MDSMQELIPFAKEMLSQKPSRGLLKVYLLGSMFAVLGTAIGLVETLCHPFFSEESVDAEMPLIFAWEQTNVEVETQPRLRSQEVEEEEHKEELTQDNRAKTQNMTPSKAHRLSQRITANRLHAS